jgi:rhomboid protease GluP
MQQPPQLPPQPPRVAVRLPVAVPRVTYALLTTIVLIFVYQTTLSLGARSEFLNNWAKINEDIHNGQYYRLFTAMFLHLNLMHIVFNGYALYVFGSDVEGLFGHARFAVIYFLGGLSGSLASFVFVDAPSVGASGAIFAIFGADIVYFYHHRQLHGEIGQRHLNQLIMLMVINLALGFFSAFSSSSGIQIDVAGHIGGLVGGVILAWLIGPSYTVQFDNMPSVPRVIDENPLSRWVLPSVIYAVLLLITTAYAVLA